jgi:Excalibur calcium-binding domain
VRAVPARTTTAPAIAALAAALVIAVPNPAAGTKPRAGCPSFSSQAEAQDRFVLLGGTPSQNARGLDEDGDGVACEGLPAPYRGFATIGYHRGRGFFYGTATMPATESGFACLFGNPQFPDGPRRLEVFLVRPGPDLSISRWLGAEARPESGRLLWRHHRDLVPGRYYAAFEERQRETPFRPPECPGFASRETYLPRGAGPRR